MRACERIGKSSRGLGNGLTPRCFHSHLSLPLGMDLDLYPTCGLTVCPMLTLHCSKRYYSSKRVRPGSNSGQSFSTCSILHNLGLLRALLGRGAFSHYTRRPKMPHRCQFSRTGSF